MGQAVIPVYFKNDTPVIGLQVPLTWIGPVSLDSVSFFGSRINYVVNKNVTIDNPNNKVLVTASVGMQQPIPEGRGMLVKFYFSTSDTGLLLYRQGQFHLECEQDPNDPGAPDSVSFYPDLVRAGAFRLDHLPGDGIRGLHKDS
jgi:hypothetical protein